MTSLCVGQTQLQLEFTGFTQEKGALMVAVFTQDNFNKAPSFAKKVAVKGDSLTLEFNNVPEGEYAVMAFQDLNGNYKLDKAPNGHPKEPFGLSQNPMLMGPPTWQALKFTLEESTEPVQIKMVNN